MKKREFTEAIAKGINPSDTYMYKKIEQKMFFGQFLNMDK